MGAPSSAIFESEDVLAFVAHELRTPAAAVAAAAAALQEGWRDLDDDRRDSLLALLSHEAARLAALVRELVEASPGGSAFACRFADVDVAELAREAAAAVELGLGRECVRVAVEGPPARVRGDRQRLMQVLENLIENSVRYSPRLNSVQVAVYEEAGRVCVDVRDDGRGVALEEQEAIFRPFVRGSAERRQGGQGLGLFVARSIAEAHGGELRLRSAPGAGATFTLVLPNY